MAATIILLLSLSLATIPTEARWPRAARPGPRPQERRTPGLPLPRQLVPRRVESSQLVPRRPNQAAPSRTARVTDWRKPKPVRTQKWGGRNYIFQDNRWKPLFDKQQQQQRTKQGRYVKQPLVKKAPPPKAPYANQRPKAQAPPQLWQKAPTWPPVTRSPFPNRRVEQPTTTSRPIIARTFPSYPANPNSIRRIDTGVVKDAVLASSLIPDVEIDGLKIYKFRGEDSMPGYIPPPDFLWSQARVTSSSGGVGFGEGAILTPPSVTPAPTPPPPTPHTWRPELPPPFPTRHTTRRPDQQRNPVIIIAQSSVQKN